MAQDNDEALRAMRLAARLTPYPELRARFEEILSVVENEQGDTFTADEAEERAFEQVRRLGQEVIQSWAERKHERLVQDYDTRRDTQRKGKKILLAEQIRVSQPGGADLSAARPAPTSASLCCVCTSAMSRFEFRVAARGGGLRGGLIICGGGREGARTLWHRSQSERGARGYASTRRGDAGRE